MNSPIPETRNSLILRLRDQRDIEAWEQFVAIYDPLVYRLARAKGMQDADAEELVQEVMASVARAVERWEPDSQRGRFRDWLFCIARNLMIDFLRRSKHRPIASGDSRNTEMLNTIVDPLSEECSSFDLEYRRELFHWAAEKVREQVRASTWQAFWMTSVEQQSITEVANKLAISVGAVHIARSRVLGRLRQMVQEFEKRDNS